MPSKEISLVVPVKQLTIGNASVGATYAAIGTFAAPLIVMHIISTFNQPVQISFDGTTDHYVAPIGNTTPAVIPIDLKDNYAVFRAPTVWVKEIGSPPNSGNLYICGLSATIP